MHMAKCVIKESWLKKIVNESITQTLNEVLNGFPFGGVPGILRLNPSELSDMELKLCIKFLSANADEYTFSEEDQMKFDSFWDELNRR